MKRNIKSIPLNLIKLDQENVRFGNDIAQNQREAIDLIMADPEDAKKLLRLAEHIAENGLDPTELQLVTPDGDGNYIVLEGNRRLTALKLLQKPDLCPNEKLLKAFIAAHNKLRGNIPNEIECSIVPTRADGDMWVELKHTGQNAGVGRVQWDSDIRDERRARQTGIESIGRQIRNLIKDNAGVFSSTTIAGVYTIPVTTLTRLFSSAPAQEAFQIKIENKEITTSISLKYIAPAVEFAINLFIDEDYNVNDIRSDEDRKRFLKHIPPELDPLYLLEKDKQDPNSQKPSNPNTNGSDNADKENAKGDDESGNKNTGGTRAKPSSRARKFLLPWSLNIANNRINEIYRDLRKTLVVESCPNATAVTFRVFIEISCDDFTIQQQKQNTPVLRNDNNRPLKTGADDKLSTKVQSVAKHLEAQEKITKAECKTIIKRASSFDSVGSIDHFNLFIHSSASAPIPSELKDIADEYRPLLEAIWA